MMKRSPTREPKRQPTGFSETISRPIRKSASIIATGDFGEGGFVLAPWEREAIHRLISLLPHQTLENLLGPLTYTVRKLREMETGEDVRGTKTDLANALIIAYSRDLLAEKPIRSAIARACRVSHPAAWYPGRESSFEFAERCGLPDELAGILATDRQPDFERLDGTAYVPRLMPFQREIYSKLLRCLRGGSCRAIASLP